MRPPATSRGARSGKAADRPRGSKRLNASAGSEKTRAVRAPSPRPGEIKVTRNSKRPQIKASRGPGGTAKRRKVAESRRLTEADRRVAETRRQSLSSLGATQPRRRPTPQSGRSNSARPTSSGGSVRAVAVNGAGGAAAATARVVAEVARPVGAAARPVLRVVSGGLDRTAAATASATPMARGRIMILIAGMLAAGLIYINVGKLEYGDGYGKYAQRATELQRENTALRASIARRSTPERIQRYAQRMGMVSPVPEQFEYVDARRGDAEKAAKRYTAPAPVSAPAQPAPSAPAPDASQTPAAAPIEPVAPPAPVTPTPTAPQTPATTGGAGL
ncbi:MAG: hypothetical protein ACPHCI_01500 [Solirubrobacterales bacterium]